MGWTCFFNFIDYELFLIGCCLLESPKGRFKIEGQFDITRAFGFHGEVPVKKFISYVPSVKSVELDSNSICLIVATKGLWKTLGYDRVADIVLQVSFVKPPYFNCLLHN